MLRGTHKSQALGGLVFLLLAQAVTAGSFGVSPVRVALSAGQTTQMLTVRNTGDADTVVQVQPRAWLFQEGVDTLEASTDLIAVPPLFTLAPGGSQVVRVGLRQSPKPGSELTYRLLLREVPPPRRGDITGLQVALELSVPVFVLPPGGAAPQLNWHILRNPDGNLELQGHNEGTSHVQVRNVRLQGAGGRVIETPALATYLLPDERHTWALAGEAATGSRWRLTARTDAGEMEADLVIESD